MFVCKKCGEESSNYDEYVGFNINNEEVSLDPYELELNSQNPDYLSYVICIYCWLDCIEK